MYTVKLMSHNVYKKSSNRTYGVLPYVAPEILKGDPPTKASDIYSFGIIILAIEICIGIRPETIDGTPNAYIQQMARCWHPDPLKRPTALELYDLLGSWSDPNKSESFNKFVMTESRNKRTRFISFHIINNI
ncbi:12505_t:CDS:2 [Funneliformis geosporum]|nr:12505_t:CDS:2 [Funneliformis geosporum]